MDLNYSAADDAFRQEVRSWLEANLPKDIQDKVLNHRRLNREDFVRWHKALAGKGWSVPHWPVEWGGTGWSPSKSTSGTKSARGSARPAFCRSASAWSRPSS